MPHSVVLNSILLKLQIQISAVDEPQWQFTVADYAYRCSDDSRYNRSTDAVELVFDYAGNFCFRHKN